MLSRSSGTHVTFTGVMLYALRWAAVAVHRGSAPLHARLLQRLSRRMARVQHHARPPSRRTLCARVPQQLDDVVAASLDCRRKRGLRVCARAQQQPHYLGVVALSCHA